LLNEETIPAHEKVFSLFEPHTEWIQKGKQRPNALVGLGEDMRLSCQRNGHNINLRANSLLNLNWFLCLGEL
jgi:hypothetical protein